MMQHFLEWLLQRPTDKPADLKEFEDSQQRLRSSSYVLMENSDELGKYLSRVIHSRPRPRVKKRRIS